MPITTPALPDTTAPAARIPAPLRIAATLWAEGNNPDSPLTWFQISEWLWGASLIFSRDESCWDLADLSCLARERGHLQRAEEMRARTNLETQGCPDDVINAWKKASEGRVTWAFIADWLRRSASFRYAPALAEEMALLSRVAEWRLALENKMGPPCDVCRTGSCTKPGGGCHPFN